MDNENWYRQLLALTILSASRAIVEWINNPSSREDATQQLRSAFAEVDYDAAAKAVTQAIDDLAYTGKDRLNGAIDTLRERSHDVVDDAKSQAQKKLGQKKGRKGRFFFGLLLGAAIAYFFLDEKRRDDLLDRLTGASGPIQQSASTVYQQATSAAQKAAQKVPGSSKGGAQESTTETQTVSDPASYPAKAPESDTGV